MTRSPATDLIHRTVAGQELTAKVVTFDRPAARRFQQRILGDEGTCFAEDAAQFRAAIATPVDLLVISTHGAVGQAAVGFRMGSPTWLEIASLSGRCTTLLLVACYQPRDRAPFWAERFSARHVVFAIEEAPAQTADRAIGRVIDRPETWDDGEAVRRAMLDVGRPAPVMVGARWDVFP